MVDTNNIVRIEYSILGTILMEPEHTGEVVAALSPGNFGNFGTRKLFEAISALHFKGAPVDSVTVVQEAGADYEVAVREALQHWIAPSNLPYYCELLREQGQLRRVQAEAMGLTTAETLKEAQECLDRVNGLMISRKNLEILSAAEAASDFYDQQKEEKPEYLHWGFDRLDADLYAELGDFIVVGGYPSAGKTLLSLQFALTLSEKYRVGYFSLETSIRKLTDRIMSHLAKVPLKKIKERDLNEADYAALAEAAVKLSTRKLDFIDAGGMTVRDIQAVALNKRYQVILVDYLQKVIDTNGGRRFEQVTNISQNLQTLARIYGIAVIALAQLSRPEKGSGNQKAPTLADFRESGQIEQDADIAMLLWPSDPNDNHSSRVLKVGKNRDGERLKMDLDFDGAIQTMVPHVPTKGEQYRELQKQIRAAARKESHQTTFTELVGDDSELPF